MQFTRRWLRALAPLVLLGSVQAQSINIDVGPNLILWPEPSSSYGAGADQVGLWNPVKNPFGGDQLFDVAGNLSGASVQSNITSSYTYPLSRLTGDDDFLTADGQAISEFGPAAVWNFTGLADGQYNVYTYCWDNSNSGATTEVSIVGSPGTTQTVGGMWAGSPHALGVTYSLHSVTVVGGTLDLQAEPSAGTSSGTVTGFQLVPGSSTASYCFGDGSGNSCPCGNIVGNQAGCQNSSGSGALLSTIGSSSAAVDDLVMSVAGGPNGTPALLFAGTTQAGGGNGTLFGDGLLCVGGQIQRQTVKILTATGDATWPSGLAATNGWVAGNVRNFQVWYRDTSSPCGTAFNLSQGVQVQYVP
jgi:hypothetical protein